MEIDVQSRGTAPRILVVEDEPVIAMVIEDMLLDLGYDVVGPVADLDRAQALADTEALDAAVLDININGRRSYIVADALRRRGIPFLFTTGYGEEGGEAFGEGVTIVQKPYRQGQIEAALQHLLSCRPEP